MSPFKTRLIIEKDGELNLHRIPFHTGEWVSVTVEPLVEGSSPSDRFPLRGSPYRLDNPFDPAVDPGDWEACR